MPEDMPDRMPDDLPVTECINVMVGITRSKVIFSIDIEMNANVLFGSTTQTGGPIGAMDALASSSSEGTIGAMEQSAPSSGPSGYRADEDPELVRNVMVKSTERHLCLLIFFGPLFFIVLHC